ncbi:hypothetical protein [Afipia felis]|uniref:OmpR/PhoB-type domain-containing protein n=2 Tax=Afipia felis TaxID=1035 RepID=A0A380W7S8_AFIFE|nr:hypothetical protein [Afipia felis]EKS26703.1 hypothetical protein HMPREF9697_04006 [Afipia felis ATCC 53690]SUU76148.1 Uncharacterised protein [Afipia felis]SUU84215.1 Uncharacterised protein [Afipia felis]SUW28221.1 Uncharacterised protein [Afipia felis]
MIERSKGPPGPICDLQYFAGRANELHLLRDRVAELEDLLGLGDQTRSKLRLLGMRRGPATFVSVLYARQGVATNAHIFAVMYGSSLDCDQPNDAILKVWAHHARKVLDNHEIKFETVWREGYRLDAKNRARLKTLLDEVQL